MFLPPPPKKSLRWLLWAGSGLSLVYLLSCCSAFLPPRLFPYITFLAIGFPLLLLAHVFWCGICIWCWGKKGLWWCLLLLPAGFNLGLLWGRGPAAPTEKTSKNLTVLSWNVNEFFQSYENDQVWQPKRSRMLAYIKKQQPDVVCFQDYAVKAGLKLENYTELISQQLGYPYHYFCEDVSDYGTIIFSRYPILQQGRKQYSTQQRTESLAFVDVLVQGDTLRIFNTHLSSMFLHHNRLNMDNIGTLDLVKDDTAYLFHSNRWQRMHHYDVVHSRQAEEAKLVLQASPYPTVFCADLNAVPNSYVYRHLQKGLKDAFIHYRWGMEGTYHSFNPFLRIDVVLYSAPLQVKYQESPRLDLSDHYPQLVRFAW